MGNTNASPTIFGFDFQVNAAIVLMLENINELKNLRLEGATEDIELTFDNGKKIYAQAKAVVKASSDFSNVRKNLKKAISTLSSADGADVDKLILVTNSVNPLNEQKSSGFFYGPPSDVGYDDLPDEGKSIIDNIVKKLGTSLATDKFRIKFFRFETDNDNERYKAVQQVVLDFINQLRINNVSAKELMGIWQNDIFKNGSKTDVSIEINKEDIIWPVIVLTIEKQSSTEILDEYDSGLADEIENKYTALIDNCVERYELVTQVLYDFKTFKCPADISRKLRVQNFIEQSWEKYIDVLALNALEDEVKKGVSRLVLTKIIQQRYVIDAIKRGVSL